MHSHSLPSPSLPSPRLKVLRRDAPALAPPAAEPTHEPGPELRVVVIGRDLGLRLERCLDSLAGRRVIYVDSGSRDGSPGRARARGVTVVELSPERPFTAARGRNAGLARALAEAGEAELLVQFVDGDCELAPGWLERGRDALEEDPGLAVVCGRLRERDPQASVYQRLCDVEWDRPVGEVEEVGGLFLARARALRDAGGFREDLEAGEEPELCLRLRRRGWRLRRISAPMAIHDAQMRRFAQWWRRQVRTGRGYATAVELHGDGPERFCVRELRRVWGWGLLLPALALGCAPPTLGASLLLLGAYPLSAARTYRRLRRRGRAREDALAYACACALDEVPQLLGVLERHAARSAPPAVELSGAAPAAPARAPAAPGG
ncbi:MAG: glycosyltransferase family A protein [Planctomycetota bacterium]